jgi:two-component system, LuxR family, sensor histidine kinase DctS
VGELTISKSALAFETGLRSKRATEPWIARFAPLGAGLAILLIFLLLGALLLLLDRDERNDDREQLIRDVLWVEQALQFQFDSERTRLLRLVKDISDGQMTPSSFTVQARQYALILPDIIEIAWLDEGGRIIASVPRSIAGEESRLAPDLKVISSLALTGGTGAYSAPFFRADGRGAIAFVAPIVEGDKRSGKVIAVFGLDLVLSHQVPWWIAEKRAVNLKDTASKVLAARSTIQPDENAPSYAIEMGQPLREVSLTLTSYRERRGLAQNGLVVAMIVLGLSAAGGLVARERQLRKRRAAEAALDEEYAFRRAMENSLLVGIRARDLDGRLLYANHAFCKMVGYSVAELVGRSPPMPYWVPEQYELTRRAHDALLAGHTIGQGLELKFQHRDGQRFDVLIYEAPLVDGQGVQRGWMGSVLDISDRKRAEEFARAQSERMQHTARLVTMGEMASLLAHDLNQPLAAIRSYQTGLANRVPMDDLTREEIDLALRGIGASAERAGLIVRRVHDFVKKSEPHLEPMQLAEVVREALDLLGPEIQKMQVAAEVDLDPQLPLVRGDRVLIQQVLVNLVRNGLEAMIHTPDDLRRLRVDAKIVSAKAVALSVTDSGTGVPPAVAEALFQPFVSTKPAGMGMGLSICRSIVELHGGHISYEPGSLGGSRFSFQLPAAEI